MPAYNFQDRFATLVETGKKLTTIRGREALIGSTAYLFTGMRTKECRRLGAGRIVECVPISVGYQQNGIPCVMLASRSLTLDDAEQLALDDGFVDAFEMMDWFSETYKNGGDKLGCEEVVFSGFLIKWELDRAAAK